MFTNRFLRSDTGQFTSKVRLKGNIKNIRYYYSMRNRNLILKFMDKDNESIFFKKFIRSFIHSDSHVIKKYRKNR